MKKKLILAFLLGLLIPSIYGHYARMPKIDLPLPPQDVRLYAWDAQVEPTPETFRERFFAPWTRQDVPDIAPLREFAEFVRKRGYYDGQGKKRTTEEIDALIRNANLASPAPPPVKAIVMHPANLRGLPTSEHMYDPPSHPTFGYPFDDAAYSRLRQNTPVLIVRMSLDGRFYLVNSYAGDLFWIEVPAVRAVTTKEMEDFQKSPLATPIREPLFLSDGEKVTIGTLFPTRNGQPYTVTQTGWEPASLPFLSPYPLPFSETAAAELAEAMQAPYAWGGIDGFGRDCSQLLQELFMSFGIYIPRNTSMQASFLLGLDVGHLSPAWKAKAIRDLGRPFETILYMRGHAMLYIGTDKNGEPLVYHAIWGSKKYGPFFQETRQVIGRTVVSGLDIGKSLFFPSLLERVEKILFVTEEKAQ